MSNQLFLDFLQYSNDGEDFFRIKNIPESEAARKLLEGVGLDVYDTVSSIKQAARKSLAKSDKRSDVV
jgi:hypothetical protein